MKKITVAAMILIMIFALTVVPVNAESDEYEADMELIQKAYDLYAMMYEAYENPEFTDQSKPSVTDEYTKKASETYGIYFKRFSNGVLTKEDFVEYISSYFAPDIANSITKETRWFKIIDGNVVMHFDGTMGWLFSRSRTEKERIIEKTADTVTYEVFFHVHNSSGLGPEESRTFIIKHGENGSRIIGGTFTEEAFNIEIDNPQTSDVPIIAVSVLAASAAAAVVILKRKECYKNSFSQLR